MKNTYTPNSSVLFMTSC